jgi:hypothetical protein
LSEAAVNAVAERLCGTSTPVRQYRAGIDPRRFALRLLDRTGRTGLKRDPWQELDAHELRAIAGADQ